MVRPRDRSQSPRKEKSQTSTFEFQTPRTLPGIDSASDRHDDLPSLLVGFHVPMGVGDGVQRKRAVDDRFQRARLETVVNLPLPSREPLGVLDDLEQCISPHCQTL